MWPNPLIPAGAVAGITALMAAIPTNQNLLSVELPAWAQVSVVFLVIFLLLWLILQSQMRYDKLLKRIDDNDLVRAKIEERRLELEKERIVADVQQTAQISSLARTIERLDTTMKENTQAVIRHNKT